MQGKRLFYWVPNWISNVLKEKGCDKCSNNIRKQDIIAIGIREVGNKTALYVEHICSKCGFREITSLAGSKKGTLEEMCYILLEEIQYKRSTDKARELEKSQYHSKITKKEMEDFAKFMNSPYNHEDFMKFIGAHEIKEDVDERSKDKN